MKKISKEDEVMEKIHDIVLRWEFAGSSKFALKRIKKCLKVELNGKERE